MSAVATIEEEFRQLKTEEIQAFKMPKPHRGQTITWYPDGRKVNGEMAHALEVGGRNIVVQRVSGVCMESVYHIDDPKLALSKDIRDQGGWDFTEESKSRVASDTKIADLEARVKVLEELFAEPKKK